MFFFGCGARLPLSLSLMPQLSTAAATSNSIRSSPPPPASPSRNSELHLTGNQSIPVSCQNPIPPSSLFLLLLLLLLPNSLSLAPSLAPFFSPPFASISLPAFPSLSLPPSPSLPTCLLGETEGKGPSLRPVLDLSQTLQGQYPSTVTISNPNTL